MSKTSITIGLVYSIEPLSQLTKCVESLRQQTLELDDQNISISWLLVCTPKTKQTDFSFFPGEIIFSQTNNLAANRNLILNKVQTDYLYFTDPDCQGESLNLKTLLQGWQDHSPKLNLFAVAGPNHVRSSNIFLQNAFASLRKLQFLNGGLSQISNSKKMRFDWHSPTCNIMYRLDRLQGLQFSPKFSQVGEDLDFHFRLSKLGKKILILPDAVVAHDTHPSIFRYLKKVLCYGSAQTHLLRTDLKSIQNKRLIVLLAFLVAIFAAFLLPTNVLGIILITSYILVTLSFISKNQKESNPLQILLISGFYFLLLATYAVGQIIGLFQFERALMKSAL